MDVNHFDQKLFAINFETVREWAHSVGDINNVLRGYTNECFVVIADFDKSPEIDFIYIEYSTDDPGFGIRLSYREKHFYDYLLMFAVDICKRNRKLEIISVYNTFTHSYRTFLGRNDIEVFFSTELNALPHGGELIIAGDYEIIKSIDRVKFYRKCLGEENFIGLKDDTNYVYLMINIEDSSFKIGQSKQPRYREGTLQSKQPGVNLLKAWECNKQIEKVLHHHFREKRLRGEWFKLDFGDLLNFESTLEQAISQSIN